MRKIQLLLCILVLSISVFAGDNADFKFIGFSEDGKYLAFEESGEWEGAGGEYATTYFVNVTKNTFAVAPSNYEWGSDGDKESLRFPRLKRYKTSVAANLRKLKIVRGNLGKLVAANLPGDHSFEKHISREAYLKQFESTSTQQIRLFFEDDLSSDNRSSSIFFSTIQYPVNPIDEQFYELNLNYVPAKLKCQQYPGDSENKAEGIELTIKPDISNGDYPVQILQKDQSIPAIRQCPSSYDIEQVWYYHGKIAVFLNYHKRGFEGDDMRYMVVM